MSTNLAMRVPDLEWSQLAAIGGLERLTWVDLRLDPALAEASQLRVQGGRVRFRRRSYVDPLPPPVADAAVEAQRARRPTAWEGLALVFARTEWLIRTRTLLWSPASPVPRLLATLVETYGIEPVIHRHDPERLARLAALLPGWHPHRGTVERARELLATCDAEAELATAVSESGATGPDAPRPEDEVMACHSLDWWEHRAEPGAEAQLRIRNGLLRFQPSAGPRFPIRREDVLMVWQPGAPLPHHAVRLLPAWVTVRLASPT